MMLLKYVRLLEGGFLNIKLLSSISSLINVDHTELNKK